MKTAVIPMLAVVLAAAGAGADTTLTINSGTPFGCVQNAEILPSPLSITGNFSFTNSSGTGTIQSSVTVTAPTFSYPPEVYFYNYTIDLSKMSSPTSHCVRLLIHFGTPEGCDYDEVWGSPSQIQSATLATFGDITFTFGGGCLSPGEGAVPFTMFSEAVPKTNIVTVIDDYVDPASGMTNEVKINVPAIVPDIPPDPPIWLYYHPVEIPFPFFQGTFVCNYLNQPFPNNLANGSFDFTMQLMDSPTNGLAVSPVVTQTVQVANSLFNVPLPFDWVNWGDGSERWLNIGVRPSGLPAVQFTPLSPPLQLTPAAQAYYAYSAGVVADLSPGQAVTSLNGLTDAVLLQAGNGIILGTNGNSIMISASGTGPSDRNLKTDFATVNPESILSILSALPIESWRYTNDMAGVRHLGPMAQDFRAAFGLGNSDKTIGYLDASGVALAAIQGLNDKLEKQAREKDAEIRQLQEQLAKLQQTVSQMNHAPSGNQATK